MSVNLVLALLSPLLLLIAVAGLVVVVALVRAPEESVPLVIEKSLVVFKWLADRLPQIDESAVERGRVGEVDDAQDQTRPRLADGEAQ